MEWISLSMLNGASKTPLNSISEANNWLYAIQKEINGMKEAWLLLPSHATAMRNDGRGWLCLELWPYEELWGPRLRLRLREKRSTVGEMTPRQWELCAVRTPTESFRLRSESFYPSSELAENQIVHQMVEMPRSPPQQNKLNPGINNNAYDACFVENLYWRT